RGVTARIARWPSAAVGRARVLGVRRDRGLRSGVLVLRPREGRFRVGPLARGIAALAAFVALTVLVATDALEGLDRVVLDAMQLPHFRRLALAASVLTVPGQGAVVGLG